MYFYQHSIDKNIYPKKSFLPSQPSSNIDITKMDIALDVMWGRLGTGYISVDNEEDGNQTADIWTDDEEDEDEIQDIPLWSS